MGNTCTYCEDLGDKVSKSIATNTNFRCPVYHSRCRWSQKRGAGINGGQTICFSSCICTLAKINISFLPSFQIPSIERLDREPSQDG